MIGPVAHEMEGEILDGFQFDIVDLHGFVQRFQIQNAPASRDLNNGQIIEVQWEPTMAPPEPCIAIHGLQDCSNRYHSLQRDVTDSLMHAIDSSNLDVSLLRGRGDEIFIEGAAAIIGINPLFWTDTFVQEVQHGSVPYGRIINNTIVGLGGTLGGDNLYEDDDFRDIGIYLEDNADPTVMNNVIVNLKQGIGSDLSGATETTIGGTLYPRQPRQRC